MSQATEAQAGTRQPVVQAAGAILWRGSSAGLEVLLVHRPRYGGGWTLPKGKLEPMESREQAARREVHEETGHEVELGSFVGVVGYDADGRPKVVHFWEAEAIGEPAGQRDAEVDAVEWLALDQALERLRYPAERALLEGWRPLPHAASPSKGAHFASAGWLRRFFDRRSLSAHRLCSSLPLLWDEIARATNRHPDVLREARDLEGWTASAVWLLLRTEQALADGDSELGWRCFKAAVRVRLLGLHSRDHETLRARATAVLRESDEKLKHWRKQAIHDLLAKDVKPDGAIDPGRVAEATRLLDEHQDNVYDRLGLLRSQLLALSFAAAITVALWILFQEGVAQWDNSRRAWLLIVLLGVMGAILSGFIRAARGRGARIPELLSNSSLSFARFALAAIAATAAALLIGSGLIRGGNDLIWIAAFAAGFSERFVVDALGQMARRARASPAEGSEAKDS